MRGLSICPNLLIYAVMRRVEKILNVHSPTRYLRSIAASSNRRSAVRWIGASVVVKFLNASDIPASGDSLRLHTVQVTTCGRSRRSTSIRRSET